ncbi:MAG: hypothetical protein V2A73_02560, partial [Pseudomonadota bacterium]
GGAAPPPPPLPTSSTSSTSAKNASDTPALELARQAPALAQLAATSHGCLVLVAARVFLLPAPATSFADNTASFADSTTGSTGAPGGGAIRELASQANTIAVQAGRILIASNEQALILDENGSELTRVAIEQGASALGLIDRGRLLVVGYDAGNLELRPIDPGTAKPTYSFEETEPHPVERISEGPRQTLIVGYASGHLGIWSLQTGKRLRRFKLHGPVIHLLVDNTSRHLFAATEVGDYLAIDLTALYQDYCELLADVWSNVPVVWERGMPALVKPPASHRCAASNPGASTGSGAR